MITLFRRFRQKLIDSGSVSKYLLYAFGEILLVVIGILIALQVNNWNEARKDFNEEQLYLQKLRLNLTQDTLLISELKSSIAENLQSIEYLSEAIEDPELPEFDELFELSLVSTVSFTPVTSTWNNLQSTGKISLISNDELNEELYLYYNDAANEIDAWSESIQMYSRNIIGPYLMQFDQMTFGTADSIRLDFDYYEKRPVEYGESLFLKNAMVYKYNSFRRFLGLLHETDQSAKNLMQMIEKELDR